MSRVHVPALPHTLITRDYDWCAYSAKLRRFAIMLVDAGHDVFMYGPEEADVPEAVEYTIVVTPDDRKRWFGAPYWDPSTVFNHWDAAADCWTEMNARVALAIRDVHQPGDIVGIIAGHCQAQILHQLKDLDITAVEWGIGYSGVLDSTHKVWESYAWAHHVAGLRRSDDISYFDTVIPNCFDPADYTVSEQTGDYLLYLGRPTSRKGLPVIAEIAKRTKLPLVIAGQPGPELDTIPGAERVGVVLGQEKAKLLAGARALLAPTSYLEPFGGVTVEAMLSGTPVITSDWGAFTETVTHDVGFRCRTLADYMDAVERSADLNREFIAEYAERRFSLRTGSLMYDAYLRRLETLRGEGWYAL